MKTKAIWSILAVSPLALAQLASAAGAAARPFAPLAAARAVPILQQPPNAAKQALAAPGAHKESDEEIQYLRESGLDWKQIEQLQHEDPEHAPRRFGASSAAPAGKPKPAPGVRPLVK